MERIADGTEGRGPRSRVPLVAEVLGYVGAALVLTAGWFVVEQAWFGWSTGVRLASLAGLAVLLLVAGVPFHRHAEEAFSRMAGVLWALSAGLMMGFAGLFASDVVGTEFGQTELVAGLAGVVYSGALLALRGGALQQIPLWVGGAFTTVGFVVAFGPTDHFCTGFVEPHWLLPAVLTFGTMWFGAIVAGLLMPTTTALVLGSATVLASPVLAVGDVQAIAPIVGLGVAVGLLVASVVVHRVTLLACGAVGLFGYLNWAVAEYFGDSVGTPFALLLSGIVVLVLALVAARRFTARAQTSEIAARPVNQGSRFGF